MSKNLELIADWNIKVYSLTSFFRSLIFTIAIIIAFLQLKLPVVYISIIYGFRYFVQMISELPTGAIADMFGKKVSLALGYLIVACAHLLLPFATSISAIFFIYGGVLAFGESFLSGADEALVYDSLKQDGRESEFRNQAARLQFIYQIGLVIGSFVGGFLYEWNVRFPFLLYAVFCFFSFVLSFLFKEPQVDSETFTISGYVRQMKLGAQEAFKNEHLRKISWFYILVGGITWACTLYFNKFLLIELGFRDSQRGLIQGGLRLLNIFVLVKLLRNETFFTKRRSILFFPLIMMIGYLPGLLLSGWSALPFISIIMMAGTARFIIIGKLVNDEFSSKYRSTALSTLSLLIGLVYVGLTMISGPIIAYGGGNRMIYSLLGLLSFVLVLPLAISIVKDYQGRGVSNK